jgi:transcriptional accessory protein Tex/SPT6
MDAVIINRIAHETAIPESSVLATVDLFEKGATGPFIVHYRKEATGGLSEAKVRLIQERMDYYREVRDKRTTLVKFLSEQGKLTDEIRARIGSFHTKVELDDLHQRFHPKKKTLSTKAIEKGLEPLAEYFWNQEPDAWSAEEHLEVFVEASKDIKTKEEALQGVVDIIAEWIGENLEYRRVLREMLEKDGFVISNVVPAKVNQKTKYNMYYERRESVTKIPSHRVLAIRRGCKEGILISSIECDYAKALEFLLSSVIKDSESVFAPVLEAAVHKSYKQILKPLIETQVRTQLKERADREAIRVFQENLTNLLLSPPAGPIVVMGVDWGKDEECSVAVVSETGTFLERSKVRFIGTGKTRRAGNGKVSTGKAQASEALPGTEISTIDPSAAVISTEPAPSITEQESPIEKSTPEADSPTTDPSAVENDTNSATSEIQKETTSAAEPPAVHPTDAANKSPEAPAAAEEDTGAGKNIPETETPEVIQPIAADDAVQTSPETLKESPPEPAKTDELPQTDSAKTEESHGKEIREPSPIQEGTETKPEKSTNEDESSKESIPDEAAQNPAPTDESATLTDTPPIESLNASSVKESPSIEDASSKTDASSETDDVTSSESEFGKALKILKDLIIKHKVRALSIGTGTRARELEAALRRIVTEENLGDILIAAVNDAGIAIYSSSRIAREEFPDWNPSARCAVSLARRLQDPLSELVKIDPKLIGVGQYQHDVDQKELHRKLLRTVQFCVNKVGVNVNTAGESLLRYISGLNEKIARRITAYRKNQGLFPSRESIPAAVGIDAATFEQAAGFLRIPEGENILDRTAIHPESYSIVQKMASTLEIPINELIGNRDKIRSLKLEDFVTDSVGIPTLKDIRNELFKPGRDPRKTFKLPNFRADVTDMSDLKTGMALEGTVTNVTNFGAFVDIGVRQDGLVHLSQMSNRFIRDPREAVKVGDIVRVKVISVEPETKRIGLSMKALLPAAHKKRRKQQRHGKSQSAQNPEGAPTEKKTRASGSTSVEHSDKNTAGKGRSKSSRSHAGTSRLRKKDDRKSGRADDSNQKKEPANELPERSLQEKIAILQSKFRRIK